MKEIVVVLTFVVWAAVVVVAFLYKLKGDRDDQELVSEPCKGKEKEKIRWRV